ncbi:MAG: hypothetical protein HN352_04275 [Bacteroidetes bacterium]|jgi:hypothetical protein|nr:hypothetical protein [Bacteroidota bacterium]MBT3751395.1 hypothetical protein [Bacteroidota bacterium]MBT4397904.1 hypothetical protein [Bacteroidota bacterium]MBT4411523.1 hypothetical protein [Bacteroidota bacterium]MBT5425908.1 hypothetical protein [Bacteroidota bacterium]
MKKHGKHIIFLVLLVLLFLPFLQFKTKLVPISKLRGSVSAPVFPAWNLNAWINGEFQQQYESAIEERIGFRPWIIRLKNQAEFSLFHKANASGVVVGKKGYLYESDYIRSYQGQDFLGEWFWNEKFARLALVRDTLTKLGVEMALVLEPGKVSFYPEYIPDHYMRDTIRPSNYDLIKTEARKKAIPTIDLNAWFVSQKSLSEYPLFPKGGIHWSNYGMIRAVDTLLRFADELTYKQIPHLIIDSIEVTNELRDTDSDLEDIMNLLWNSPHPRMAYPEFSFSIVSDSLKPRVLSISDSFFFNILNAGIPGKAFANEAFWYYSNTIYPDTWTARKDTSMINIREEVEQMDLILLMLTERFYYKMSWNFIDHLYKQYYPDEMVNYLYDYFAAIIRNFEWFDLVQREAGRKSISMEASMREHAFYQFWRDDQDGKIVKDAAFYAMKIRKDTTWYNKVAAKAVKNGIDVEKQLALDALWLENQEDN